MDLKKIAAEVAATHGIDPDRMENGSFSIPEWQILYPLVEKVQQTQSEEDWRRYLEQKAKFLTGK
jgi:hypothetical protein